MTTGSSATGPVWSGSTSMPPCSKRVRPRNGDVRLQPLSRPRTRPARHPPTTGATHHGLTQSRHGPEWSPPCGDEL